MPTAEITEFAQILVQHVRDAAIQESDRELHPDAHSPIAQRWRQAASDGAPEHILSVSIPDVVDDAVFHLLHAIDDGLLRISFTASNGRTVDLTTEGRSELAGWFMGSGGWRAMFSRERFIDDFSDLTKDSPNETGG